MNKSLRTSNLVKAYKGRIVVNGVDLEVKDGEVVGLLGPNGAGKTTAFRMIIGLISPQEGEIFLGEKDITKLPIHKRAQLGLGYLSQEPSIFRHLSVEENILAILQTLNLPKEEESKRLGELLKELKVDHLRQQRADTLSGGERRRVEIARSLVTNPSFMLLDEPFVGIDPITVNDLQEVIRELKEKGIGLLITDHNVRETLEITDRAYIMYQGEILISGSANELINNPKAREIYLGEKFKI
ncbi:LPS export ABC transporter ATP-binding protein [bacterium]|nr:LPS export ABC transporter ATP-binding protein [bacterium]